MRRRVIRSVLRVLLVLGILAPSLLFAIPAQAAMSQPDSAPTIDQSKIHINRNLITSGDIVFYAPYLIPYATAPDTLASASFIFQLIDTDGTTVLGTITPYTYFDNGYDAGVLSLYFGAGNSLVWGSAYYIRIAENPAEFSSPVYWDYAIPASAWSSFTAQTDGQTEMAAYVIDLATDLEAYYSGTTLLETSGGQTILAQPAGENYFRGAIYGLQSMAPSLFLVEVVPIDVTSTNWTTAQFDSYETRFDGTWVGTAETATANQWGLSVGGIMGMVLILVLSLAAVIVSSMKYQGKNAYGWCAAGLLLIMGALLGWIPTAVFALSFQIMLIYTGYVLFWTKGRDLNFFGYIWVGSTIICMVLEGTYIGSHGSRTIINEVSALFSMNIGSILTLPGILLDFFHGVMRMFLFDYSFYSGAYQILRWVLLVCFTGGAVYEVWTRAAPIFSSFVKPFGG